MLVIRLSRTGKRHQPYYRIIVSDKRKAPTAKFIEIIGNYDPHQKKITVDKEKLELYMKNGAQPSNTLAKLLKAEKISLPKWVKITEKKKAKKVKKGAEEKPVANPTKSKDDADKDTGEAEDKTEKTTVVEREATENASDVEVPKIEETNEEKVNPDKVESDSANDSVEAKAMPDESPDKGKEKDK